MNIRQRKKVIWLAAGLVGACAAGIIVAGLALPVDVVVKRSSDSPYRGAVVAASPAQSNDANTPSPGGSASAGPEFVAQLRQLCRLDLRKPLYDPPPAASHNAAAAAQVVANSLLSVRLVGTADEPGHSMAVFQKPDGAIEVCAQGQGFELQGSELTVVTVQPHKVAVRYAGKRHELVIPRKP